LSLGIGAIEIKNVGKDVLVMSSWRIVNNVVQKSGAYTTLEPGQTQRFQFCKEWIISVSHSAILIMDFTIQGEKYNKAFDELEMASKY